MSAKKVPSRRHHKPSGLAVVTLNGRDIYLGRHDDPESVERYNRVVAEWMANNRRLPPPPGLHATTVTELIRDYMRYAKNYYRKNGNETGEIDACKHTFNPLRALYGRTLASEFGPRALRAVRERFVQSGLCRKTVNDRIQRIKRLFKWGTEYEMVPAGIYEVLRAVAGLRKGRTTAPESTPIRPIEITDVEAVLPHVSGQVASMIRLQLLTGMRPGEVVILRTRDIERENATWTYRPLSHKTEHHGITREIALGPRAQTVLRPWLRADPDAYLFSPKEAEDARMRSLRATRKTRVQPSQRNRKKKSPLKNPGHVYDVHTYRRAIHRGCDAASVTRWSPNRLRHTFATSLRKSHGIEAARVILGHHSAQVTEIYAELDRSCASKIMEEVG